MNLNPFNNNNTKYLETQNNLMSGTNNNLSGKKLTNHHIIHLGRIKSPKVK